MSTPGVKPTGAQDEPKELSKEERREFSEKEAEDTQRFKQEYAEWNNRRERTPARRLLSRQREEMRCKLKKVKKVGKEKVVKEKVVKEKVVKEKVVKEKVVKKKVKRRHFQTK